MNGNAFEKLLSATLPEMTAEESNLLVTKYRNYLDMQSRLDAAKESIVRGQKILDEARSNHGKLQRELHHHCPHYDVRPNGSCVLCDHMLPKSNDTNDLLGRTE